MYKLYLRNTEVEVPTTLQNLTFEKVRDSFYWGFIYNKIGRGQNVQLTFTEDLAIRIIRDEYKSNGIRGNLPVYIEYFGQIVYKGSLDSTSLEFNANECSCVLTDPIEVDDFFANQSTVYAIPTTKQITLPSITTTGLVNYTLENTLTYEKLLITGQTPWHTIPFKTDKDNSISEGSVYEPFQFNDTQNIYINTTDEQKTINITGRIKFQAYTSDSSVIQVVLGGIIVANFQTSSSYQNFEFGFDETLILSPNEGVQLVIGNNNNVSFGFIYDNSSFLILNESKEELPLNTDVIPSVELLRNLLSKISTSLQLSYNAPIVNFTNGKNVRGFSSDINASFFQVFSVLNNLFCLKLSVIDNVVYVEKRTDISAKGKRIFTSDYVNDYRFYPSTDIIHNVVTVGYRDWKPSSVIGGDEYNAIQVHETEFKNISNPLDLTIDAIGSRYIIDETRDLYFQTKSSDKGTSNYDDRIFVISLSDNIQGISGILNENSPLNISLSPRIILDNWSRYIIGSTSLLSFEANNGYEFILEGKTYLPNYSISNENKLFSGDSFTLDLNIDLNDYSILNEVVGFYDEEDNLHQGIIKSVTLTQSLGTSKAIIEAWKLL